MFRFPSVRLLLHFRPTNKRILRNLFNPNGAYFFNKVRSKFLLVLVHCSVYLTGVQSDLIIYIKNKWNLMNKNKAQFLIFFFFVCVQPYSACSYEFFVCIRRFVWEKKKHTKQLQLKNKPNTNYWNEYKHLCGKTYPQTCVWGKNKLAKYIGVNKLEIAVQLNVVENSIFGVSHRTA